MQIWGHVLLVPDFDVTQASTFMPRFDASYTCSSRLRMPFWELTLNTVELNISYILRSIHEIRNGTYICSRYLELHMYVLFLTASLALLIHTKSTKFKFKKNIIGCGIWHYINIEFTFENRTAGISFFAIICIFYANWL